MKKSVSVRTVGAVNARNYAYTRFSWMFCVIKNENFRTWSFSCDYVRLLRHIPSSVYFTVVIYFNIYFNFSNNASETAEFFKFINLLHFKITENFCIFLIVTSFFYVVIRSVELRVVVGKLNGRD